MRKQRQHRHTAPTDTAATASAAARGLRLSVSGEPKICPRFMVQVYSAAAAAAAAASASLATNQSPARQTTRLSFFCWTAQLSSAENSFPLLNCVPAEKEGKIAPSAHPQTDTTSRVKERKERKAHRPEGGTSKRWTHLLWGTNLSPDRQFLERRRRAEHVDHQGSPKNWVLARGECGCGCGCSGQRFATKPKWQITQ